MRLAPLAACGFILMLLEDNGVLCSSKLTSVELAVKLIAQVTSEMKGTLYYIVTHLIAQVLYTEVSKV